MKIRCVVLILVTFPTFTVIVIRFIKFFLVVIDEKKNNFFAKENYSHKIFINFSNKCLSRSFIRIIVAEVECIHKLWSKNKTSTTKVWSIRAIITIMLTKIEDEISDIKKIKTSITVNVRKKNFLNYRTT